MALSRVALSMAAKASLVGAKTVMSGVVLRVSPRPASVTAVTSVDRTGLLLAAVATGSLAMPPNEPAPSAGTAAQPGPNGAPAMSVPIDSEAEAEGAGADDELMVSVEPASISLSEPQAAIDRGRARARAATVSRVERMGGAPSRRCVSWCVHQWFGAAREPDWPARTTSGTLAAGATKVPDVVGGAEGQSMVTTMVCQPRAPSGNGVVRPSGCSSPVRSVARTLSEWRPGAASHARYHWRQ